MKLRRENDQFILTTGTIETINHSFGGTSRRQEGVELQMTKNNLLLARLLDQSHRGPIVIGLADEFSLKYANSDRVAPVSSGSSEVTTVDRSERTVSCRH